MKKFFKILLIIFGSIVGMIIIVIGLAMLFSLYTPGYDISPSAYHWEKNMSEAGIDSTAHVLLNQMSLVEKVDQMDGDGGMISMVRLGIRFLMLGKLTIQYAGRNERLDIPPIAFSDGPRGITVGQSTAFPVAMARGAIWDTALEQKVGDVIGEEGRVLGVNYFGGVCINLLRHPAWGRSQETFGEDPYLLGEMVVALTRGVQKHNVMACAKHYAMNSVECARFYIDVKADERTMNEVYFPHFRKFVEAGGASIMSAYNKVNGLYCGNNYYLLTTVLRDQWGFRGFISSDWMNGTRDGIASAKAGLDIEMPIAVHYGDSLVNDVQSGKIEEYYVDSAVLRILRTKLRFITREDPEVYSKSMLASKEHVDLAREVAEKSFVLLKNDRGFLPLGKENIKKLAVIGHLADEPCLGDHGSSMIKPKYVITILQGLKNYLGKGVAVSYADGKDIAIAKKMASEADATVIIAGYDYNDEGEYVVFNTDSLSREKTGVGGDRLSLSLHPEDENLISEIASVNKKCMVGMIGGGAIMVEKWKDLVPSIMMLWYPGMEGGNAFARVIFGEVNPGGKLPFTVPSSVDQLPQFDPFARSVTYDLYHGYTLADRKGYKPAFPFGFGMSYTTFQYDSIWTDKKFMQAKDTLTINVKLTNTGPVNGDEVVQLYIGFKNSSIDRPVKLLRGFRRVSISKGESKIAQFKITAGDLTWYNPGRKSWEYEKMEYEAMAGPSSDNSNLITIKFAVKD
jgi:beta-glucosidase